MTREIRRAYRVLGLRPGATSDEVRAAYHDLAQVWHPDRFSHSDRLRDKAEKNLTRINESYQILRNYQPPVALSPESIISTTMSAVLDMGDLLQSRAINRERIRVRTRVPRQPDGRRRGRGRGRGPRVVGLQEWERTGVLKGTAPRRPPRLLWAGLIVAGLLVAGALVLVLPATRRWLFGP